MKLQSKFKFKSIEEIALQFIKQNEPQTSNVIETNKTLVDKKFYIKKYTNLKNSESTLTQSYEKLVPCEEISNSKNKVKLIKFFKLPQKDLCDDEDFPFTADTEDENINHKPSKTCSQKSLKNNNVVSSIKLREVRTLKNDDNNIFAVNYQNMYDCINQIYYPLLQNLETISSLKSTTDNTLSRIDYCVSHSSVFELFKTNTPNNIIEFIEELKIYENIEFSLILFILHITLEAKIEYLDNISEEDIIIIYQNSYLSLQKLYEIIILFLLNNEYNNSNTNIELGSDFIRSKAMKNETNVSYVELCSNSIKDFYKFVPRPNNIEQIINKINENMFLIVKLLTDSINVLISNLIIFKHESGNLDNPDEEEILFLSGYIENNTLNSCQKEKTFLSKEFSDQYNTFKTMFLFCTNHKDNSQKIFNKDNNIESKSNTNNNPLNLSSDITSSEILKKFTTIFASYTEINTYFLLYYSNFKILLEKNKVKPPFLPPIDSKKYEYTLVVDLDETLVHYIEEENRAYVQVRPYADYFLTEMSKNFEIVIFTAAAEDYADIVLNELDKNNEITYKLYRKHTEQLNGIFIKDLSKLGRDLSKVCIIDNNKDNFSLQPENGLHICSFLGDQNDDELYLLCEDLQKIISSKKSDIRPIIKEIDGIMKKRYEKKDVVLE